MLTNEIVFKIAPVAKARPRIGKNGHVYTPLKTAVFEESIRYMAKTKAPKEPLSGPVEVHLWFVMPEVQSHNKYHHVARPDLDNLIKAVCDALNGIVWKDDCQIAHLRATKTYAAKGEEAKIILNYYQLASL